MYIVEIAPDRIREGLHHLCLWIKEFEVFTDGVSPTIIVAMEDDLPIGIALYHHIRVHYISVHPSHRGQGVGKKLIEYITAQVKSPLLAYIPQSSKEEVACFVKWRFLFTGFYIPHDTTHDKAYYRMELTPTQSVVIRSDMYMWKELDMLRDEIVVVPVLPVHI